jgi:hypothetical protein
LLQAILDAGRGLDQALGSTKAYEAWRALNPAERILPLNFPAWCPATSIAFCPKNSVLRSSGTVEVGA